jgi:methionine synthase II (cobalamin-independent)
MPSELVITGSTTLEELVAALPEAVSVLAKRGIRCIVCGEPVWGTLAEAVRDKGMSADQLSEITDELNRMVHSS